MARNLAAELEEWDGTFPPCWKPREGETLVGVVKRYSTGHSVYGPQRTCVIEQENGERVSVWLSSVVLLGLFQEQRPAVGERIGLKFCGAHPTKKYKRYTLLVDREEAALDFSPLGGEQGEAAEGDGDPFSGVPEQPRGARTTDRASLPYATTTMGGRR